MLPTAIALAEVMQWLHDFSTSVRNRDIEAGLTLFAKDVASFGTRAVRALSLDELSEQQWRPTWSRTQEFCFIDESVHVIFSDTASQAVVLALWQSSGVDSADSWRSQQPRLRRGRSTIVLRRNNNGELISEHTHFSLYPDPAKADQVQ